MTQAAPAAARIAGGPAAFFPLPARSGPATTPGAAAAGSFTRAGL